MSDQFTLRLWWCTTPDHDEDWCVIARTRLEARRLFAREEGYDLAYVRARTIARFPADHRAEVGWPSAADLEAVGAVEVEGASGRAELRVGGRCYLEGGLQAELTALLADRSTVDRIPPLSFLKA